jgi:D-aminopeptidase
MRIHAAVGVALVGASALAAEPRPRARDLGITPGIYEPGRLNAITDVEGVRVGHTTLVAGAAVRTGVTAVVPHGGNLFRDKVAAAVFVGNAFGKLAGSTQVQELGTLETPIVLTNTLAVGTAVEALVAYTLADSANADARSVNAVVGETNDGGLNDIRGRHVTRDHVLAAVRGATGGAPAEGNVGAGTGTRAFDWKGGIGTASRVLPAAEGGHTVGVLVQVNYGGQLTIAGVPVGRELRSARASGLQPTGDGSCIVVVATDAALTTRDLERLATRGIFALARTGSSFSHGSGDYAIAFSTSPETRTRHGETTPRTRTLLPSDAVSPLFQAVLEATEEAVYNAMLRAETMTGNGLTVEALPIDRLRALLTAYGRQPSNRR